MSHTRWPYSMRAGPSRQIDDDRYPNLKSEFFSLYYISAPSSTGWWTTMTEPLDWAFGNFVGLIRAASAPASTFTRAPSRVGWGVRPGSTRRPATTVQRPRCEISNATRYPLPGSNDRPGRLTPKPRSTIPPPGQLIIVQAIEIRRSDPWENFRIWDVHSTPINNSSFR